MRTLSEEVAGLALHRRRSAGWRVFAVEPYQSSRLCRQQAQPDCQEPRSWHQQSCRCCGRTCYSVACSPCSPGPGLGQRLLPWPWLRCSRCASSCPGSCRPSAAGPRLQCCIAARSCCSPASIGRCFLWIPSRYCLPHEDPLPAFGCSTTSCDAASSFGILDRAAASLPPAKTSSGCSAGATSGAGGVQEAMGAAGCYQRAGSPANGQFDLMGQQWRDGARPRAAGQPLHTANNGLDGYQSRQSTGSSAGPPCRATGAPSCASGSTGSQEGLLCPVTRGTPSTPAAR